MAQRLELPHASHRSPKPRADNLKPEPSPPGAGAVLVSDITGFTALTEKLSSRGSEGVELLTRCMNEYFAMARVPPHAPPRRSASPPGLRDLRRPKPAACRHVPRCDPVCYQLAPRIVACPAAARKP